MRLDTISAVVACSESAVRELTAQVLIGGGLRQIWRAPDGAAAFLLVCHRRPSVVLLDFDLLQDSIVALRQIRRSPNSPAPDVPVLTLTAQVTQKRIEALRDAGVTAVVSKPFTSSQLFGRIVQVLKNPKPFVAFDAYAGPDRRIVANPQYAGPFRRGTDVIDTLEIDVA
jgi:two-component system, chemotaxis family, chemotaxis protein CheY